MGKTDRKFWSYRMYGASMQSTGELAVLGKSWLQPPSLKILKGDFISSGYDFTQRAYILECKNKDSGQLEMELLPDSESPMVNACLVINGWENENVTIQLNGNELERNKDYRIGKRRGLESDDLMIWIEKKSETNMRILIKEN